MLQNSGTMFVDIALDRSRFFSMRYQIAKTATWFNPVGRQPVHLNVSLVAYDQPHRLIEQRQALRHVVDGGIEALLFQRQSTLRCEMLRRQPPNDQGQNDGYNDRRKGGGDNQELGLRLPVGER